MLGVRIRNYVGVPQVESDVDLPDFTIGHHERVVLVILSLRVVRSKWRFPRDTMCSSMSAEYYDHFYHVAFLFFFPPALPVLIIPTFRNNVLNARDVLSHNRDVVVSSHENNLNIVLFD